MAPTLLHLHIPKCAGVSVRAYLDGAYGPAVAPEDLSVEQPTARARRARTISGHFDFGLHEALGREALYFIVMRDPIARLESLFRYIRAMPAHKHHALLSRPGASLADLYRSAPGRMKLFTNGQARQIAGVDGPGMLETALENSAREDVVIGTLEDLPAALRRLAAKLELKAAEVPTINTTDGARVFDERDRAAAVEQNAADIELYRIVSGREPLPARGRTS